MLASESVTPPSPPMCTTRRRAPRAESGVARPPGLW